MAQQWCKVASNLDTHPKIRRAGRLGREVFLFALRRNAEPCNQVPGFLPHQVLEPWFIADLLMMTEEEAEKGVTMAVTAGLLTPENHAWRINGWDPDWGKKPLSGAERTAGWRERKKTQNHQLSDSTSARDVEVTFSDDGDVTNVTRGDAGDGCDVLEEKRLEETSKKTPIVPKGDVSRDVRKRKSKPAEPTPTERDTVRLVLDKLSKQNGVNYSGSQEHTRLIVARLRDGITEMDLRCIVGYCASELGWRDKPEMAAYLRPETLFGPRTIERYRDPARTWAEANGLLKSNGVNS